MVGDAQLLTTTRACGVTGHDGAADDATDLVELPARRSRLGPARIAALLVGTAMAALLVAVLVTMNRPETVAPSPAVGELVPPLSGTTLDGESFDIDDLRGQWVALNLFATWCVPCQVEHPELVAFDEAHRRRGDARVVSVVFGDSDDAVRDFFAERGGQWPVLGEDYSSVIVDLGATGVPETFMVAPNGIIVERILGGVTRDLLDGIIDRYTNRQ